MDLAIDLFGFWLAITLHGSVGFVGGLIAMEVISRLMGWDRG